MIPKGARLRAKRDQIPARPRQAFFALTRTPDSATLTLMTPRTRIRLIYEDDRPVHLEVPYNPHCRLSMIRRTVKTLWPRAKGKARERREAEVMVILGTALCPTRR